MNSLNHRLAPDELLAESHPGAPPGLPGESSAAISYTGGQARLLEQLFVERPGHCTFTDDEMLTALDVLLKRLDRGRWPRDAGSGFADYEPPPFLRPFDLAPFSAPRH